MSRAAQAILSIMLGVRLRENGIEICQGKLLREIGKSSIFVIGLGTGNE